MCYGFFGHWSDGYSDWPGWLSRFWVPLAKRTFSMFKNEWKIRWPITWWHVPVQVLYFRKRFAHFDPRWANLNRRNRPSAFYAHGLYLLTVSRSARIFSGNIVRLKPRLSGPQWFWLLGLSDPHKPLKCNLYLKNWKTPNHQGITINRSHRVHRKKKVTLKYE